MQVDIASCPDMSCHHAANQPRPMAGEKAHQAKCFEAHLAEVVLAGIPFVQPCERLDFVPDFRIARQIGRFDPALANAMGRLLLGPKVFRLLAGVHQPGGFEGNLPPQLRIGHRVRRKPRKVARVGMGKGGIRMKNSDWENGILPAQFVIRHSNFVIRKAGFLAKRTGNPQYLTTDQ
jgi:hypothetical protein